MSAITMLLKECKIIAREKIPRVEEINDQLEVWVDDAEKELEALKARIAELEALTTWQPIETAPKDVEILVEDDDGVIHHVEMENGVWVSLSNKLEEVYGIVNWMQLPKPPEEK